MPKGWQGFTSVEVLAGSKAIIFVIERQNTTDKLINFLVFMTYSIRFVTNKTHK